MVCEREILILGFSYPWAMIARRRVQIKLPRKLRAHTFSCVAPTTATAVSCLVEIDGETASAVVSEPIIQNLAVVAAAATLREVDAHG